MDETFIAERITRLRLALDISEYQMSLELGQCKSYIQGITSGKNLPSVRQLFNIADYFDMSMSEFFSEESGDPPTVRKAVRALRQLDESDAALVLTVVRRLSREKERNSDRERPG